MAKLAPFPGLIGLASALAYAVAGANAAAGSSASTTSAGDCVTVLLQLTVLASALISLGRARDERLTGKDEHPAGERPQARLPWVVVAMLAWLALAASFIAVLLGYLALASFIMRETIWVGMILAALFLLMRFVDDVFPTLLSPERSIGRSIRIAVGFSPEALEQIGVLLSGPLPPSSVAGGGGARSFCPSAPPPGTRSASCRPPICGAPRPGVDLAGGGLGRPRRLPDRHGRHQGRCADGSRPSICPRPGWISGCEAPSPPPSPMAAGWSPVVVTCAYLGLSLDKIALFASALSVGIGLWAAVGDRPTSSPA